MFDPTKGMCLMPWLSQCLDKSSKYKIEWEWLHYDKKNIYGSPGLKELLDDDDYFALDYGDDDTHADSHYLSCHMSVNTETDEPDPVVLAEEGANFNRSVYEMIQKGAILGDHLDVQLVKVQQAAKVHLEVHLDAADETETAEMAMVAPEQRERMELIEACERQSEKNINTCRVAILEAIDKLELKQYVTVAVSKIIQVRQPWRQRTAVS